MINQSTVNLALVLSLAICTIISGLLAQQTIWVFAQGNLSQGMNQTGNQTGNQSLSPLTPGQLGGTPPG
jgi:hypothetical protein